MRTMRHSVRAGLAAVAAALVLAGCSPNKIKSGDSDGASATESSTDATTGAQSTDDAGSSSHSKPTESNPSGLPAAMPTNNATTEMLKSVLPPAMQRNITQKELQLAIRDGILVRTMNGGNCRSSSSDPDANTVWTSVLGFKPGAQLSVTVQSTDDPNASPVLGGMHMKADQQGFAVLSFGCEVPAGKYVVTVSGPDSIGGEGASKRSITVA